jgi:hypothetical protein
MNEAAEHLLTRVSTHILTPESRTRPAHPDWPGAIALNGDAHAQL